MEIVRGYKTELKLNNHQRPLCLLLAHIPMNKRIFSQWLRARCKKIGQV